MFLGSNFEKPLSYLKSTPSNLPYCKVWCKKTPLKFGTANVWFGYFWAWIWKYYCHIWNQHILLSYLKSAPRICLIAKFRIKTKMPKFRTKNALFVYFWTVIWKNYCHIWNQHLRICLSVKFCEKMKMSKFLTKNALILG